MSGLWYGVAAYSLWGLLTLYWRLFPHVPAIQVLGHRIVWSFLVLVAIVAGSWKRRRAALRSVTPGVDRPLRACGGPHRSQLVPLRLRGQQRLHRRDQSRLLHHAPRQRADRRRGLSRAAAPDAVDRPSRSRFAGVVRLTLAYGTLPWIALALAASFGSYGLVEEESASAVARGAHPRNRRPPRARGSLSALPRPERDRSVPARWCDDRSCCSIAGGFVTVVPLLLFATPFGACRCRSSASCSTSHRPFSSCSVCSCSTNRLRAPS